MSDLNGQTMGTAWSARFYRDAALDDRDIQDQFEQLFSQSISEFSNWEDSSTISRFNRAKAGEIFEIPEGFASILSAALELAHLTDGAFNPCLGSYTKDLEFGPGGNGQPQVEASADWKGLDWDASSGQLHQSGNVMLDLSAIAKGYVVDGMAEILEQCGIQNFLVEIGGEYVGRGVKADRTPWWVDVETVAGGEDVFVAALHGLAVASSGNSNRFLATGGNRMSHIIRNTCDHDRQLASVTVFHNSCMWADAWATALFSLEAAKGKTIAEEQGLTALFQVSGGGFFITPGLSKMMDLSPVTQ
ncbi:FAD:protein FMN transferase [Emcibacter sp.]|uniref:FAD:protein FMN transferase n=1 Tax=Emcibacter sp. TaxID=1979954 RepID=UPI003A94CBC4